MAVRIGPRRTTPQPDDTQPRLVMPPTAEALRIEALMAAGEALRPLWVTQ
jgi:hypothetical protein